MKKFFKSKTNWTCIIGGIGALGAYLSGEISGAMAVQSGLAALAGIFMRQGVEKSGPAQ